MTMPYEDRLFYHYRPRPIGGDVVLSLDDDTLHLATGLKVSAFPFKTLKSVQIVFRPSSLFTKRYMVIVTDNKGKRIKFSNVTYRGFAEMIDQNDQFVTFIQAFHDKLKKYPAISFQGGEPAWRYYPVCLIAIAMVIVGIAVIQGSFSQSIWLTLAIVAIFSYMVFTMWQWVTINKPQNYTAGNIPVSLMP